VVISLGSDEESLEIQKFTEFGLLGAGLEPQGDVEEVVEM
jgi:hypothetical protein